MTTGFSETCASYLKDTLAELLKKYPDQQKKLEECNRIVNYDYDEKGNRTPKPFTPFIKCMQEEKYNGRYAVKFLLKLSVPSTPLIAFTLDLYPECCALHQLNGFHHCDSHYLDEEFFFEFIKRCISAYTMSVNVPRRLMINFVREHSDHRPDIIPAAVENPRILYPMWYRWACRYPKQETLFANHNTHRIIHNTIINLEG